jgi:hypothetical protein
VQLAGRHGRGDLRADQIVLAQAGCVGLLRRRETRDGAGEQELGENRMVGGEPEGRGQRGANGGPAGRRGVNGRGDRVEVLPHAAVEQRVVHRRPRVEVLVQRGLPQADAAGDLGEVQRRHAMLGHHRERRVQDLLPGP